MSRALPLLLSAMLAPAQQPEPGVQPDLDASARPLAAWNERFAAAPPVLDFAAGGLAAVRGAAQVQLVGRRAATVRLPLPERHAGQIPFGLAFDFAPRAAVAECRLVHEPVGGTALVVRLLGERGTAVRCDWLAMLLLAECAESAAAETALAWLEASPCAEHGDERIAELAAALAPAEAGPAQLAAALQQWIVRQPAKGRPSALSALGFLEAGNFGVCTMNANLAVALLRHRGVPARSLAVVPTNGVRLEMHRIVEWFDDGRWWRFDPSLVHSDVPMRIAQSVLMAITAIDHEQRAGEPRVGVPAGCPWGQEIEILGGPAVLAGDEFYWTQARPLAGFAATAEMLAAAGAAHARWLATGRTDAAALRAAVATGAVEFAAAWAAGR